MGFLDWITGRARADRESDRALLKVFLESQQTRIVSDAEVSKLEREIKLKEKQLELDHLEAIHEERRKDAAARETLRAQRKQWAASAREKLAQKRAAGVTVGGGLAGCKACANPADVSLTADEIRWHSAGHPGAMQRS